MTSDERKRILDLALSLLSENRPAEALQALDKTLPEFAANPDQLAYRGLALAKLGKPNEALQMFRNAVELAPYEARQNYLLAIQLRDEGKTEEARKYAEAARIADPKFPGMNELLGSLRMPTSDPRMRLRERLSHPLPRPPEGPVHAFPTIEAAGNAWTACGWALVALNVLAVVLIRFHSPLHMPEKNQAQGLPALGGLMPNADALSVISLFLLLAAIVLCVLWTLVDMLDRRARFLWFVPVIPLCLCGTPGVGLALYIGLGRK